MSKRQKIIFASIISAALIFVAMTTDLGPGLLEVVSVTVVAYLLSVWALQPGLEGREFFYLLALPTLLTVGSALTAEIPDLPIPWKYFLPPVYGAVLYVTLLAGNIFNVSTSRHVPLLRAARTVGYLLTLGVTFLVSTLLFTRHLPSYFNFLAALLVGGAAVGQALWQVDLGERARSKLLLGSLVSAVSVGELAFVISFWPVNPLAAGLAVTTLVYLIIGMIQHDWQENLNRRTVVEYILVSAGVMLLLLFSTSWGG